MSTKLFVGNLSWGVTDDSLRAAFEAIGDVVSATVLTDRMSGRSRGFGFVEMANAEDAQNAISQLNDSELDGRPIIVNEARPQERR